MNDHAGSGHTDSNRSESERAESRLFVGSRYALYGGIIAGAVALGGQWLIGSIYSGYEARQLLEAMSSSAHYFGSAIVTGSATILALMLTILSLTSQSDSDFDRGFYLGIKRIGTLATISLIGGILLLLFLTIPVKESDDSPASWFTHLYYFLMGFLALLAGLLISIVLMLQNAIGNLISVIRPSDDENDKEPRQNAKFSD